MAKAWNPNEYWPGYHRARLNIYAHGYEWARMIGKELEATKPFDYMRGYKRYLKDACREYEYSRDRLLETA